LVTLRAPEGLHRLVKLITTYDRHSQVISFIFIMICLVSLFLLSTRFKWHKTSSQNEDRYTLIGHDQQWWTCVFVPLNDTVVLWHECHSDMDICERMNVDSILTVGYGPEWRLHRKLFHQHMGRTSMQKHSSRIEEDARTFVYQLHRDPEDFMNHIRR
jgi:hypothetical protein